MAVPANNVFDPNNFANAALVNYPTGAQSSIRSVEVYNTGVNATSTSVPNNYMLVGQGGIFLDIVPPGTVRNIGLVSTQPLQLVMLASGTDTVAIVVWQETPVNPDMSFNNGILSAPVVVGPPGSNVGLGGVGTPFSVVSAANGTFPFPSSIAGHVITSMWVELSGAGSMSILQGTVVLLGQSTPGTTAKTESFGVFCSVTPSLVVSGLSGGAAAAGLTVLM